MKKPVMSKEELDKKILNRIPHSGFHPYDGFMFLSTLLAYRRKKKNERKNKLRIIEEQKIESSNYEENIYVV